MKDDYSACHRGGKSSYDDGNIPEIDLPGAADATRDIPQEFNSSRPELKEDDRPRKDGPGGE
ncbi:MAG: hypothetical protein UDG86_13795 [Lachnospiraceae bacterium]|jgi:hypothetical protein|nr:hypothetical protein [Lachnospiraceae bacterium]